MLKNAMEVCLQHCTVCTGGGKEGPAITIHALVDDIETYHIGFLS